MSLPLEELKKLLSEGNAEAVRNFFKGASEAERRAAAPTVLEWCRRLQLNWAAQFNRKAAAEVNKAGAIKNWHGLTPIAQAAALATANLTELRTLDHHGWVLAEAAKTILADRRPPWVGEYAELLSGGEAQRWGGNWKTVRTLVRAGLCRPPQHENYVLEALNGIWPPYDRSKPQPTLVNLLLKEPDWLEKDFWRLFELEGNGEVSLANSEKYGRSEQTWSEAIVELSKRKVIARDRLLDASLSALSRDFVQFRSGWFSRFHEALQPTPAERAERVDVYLHLLGSSIPPTVALAVNAIAVVDKVEPLPAAKLISGLQPTISARGKAVVKSTLQLLDAAAKREPAARESVCLAAVPALLNEAVDVQKAVLHLLDSHGQPGNKALRLKLEDCREGVAASLRKRLESWLGATAGRAKLPSGEKEKALSRKVLSRIDPTRTIEPIGNLDDLIHIASQVLEEPSSPADIERVLDGVSRLCDQRPEDFERRTDPLRKRALKKCERHRGSWFVRPALERGLGMLLLTWIEGKNAFSEKPEDMADGQNQYTFLFRRLVELGDRIKGKQAMPLLSAPTHLGGWIEPRVLTERWLAWQKAGLDVNLHEQVLALLRLAPEGRERALKAAKDLTGESGEAMRFALGDKCKTGKTSALWLAAWRSRQPYDDLPEFETKHPGLGPDAGVAAHYTWKAEGRRHKCENQEWTSLEFELRTTPHVSKKINDALVPTMFHRAWETSEEGKKDLMRWASAIWPANREATFARGCKRLAISVDYADANDREFAAYLEPLAEPHTDLRPMACLALAIGLAAEDTALRNYAQDGLIAAIDEGRLNVQELGSAMERLLATGIHKLARWAKALREVARVSPEHARAAASLIIRTLQGDPTKAPRNVSVLLEVLFELLSETGDKLNDTQTRAYLENLKLGGKTAKLARQLLEIG